MSVKGDFAKLAGLVGRLTAIASGKGWSRLCNEMGQESLKLVQEGFAGDKDPYGAPWAPLKPSTLATGGSRILKRTEHMRKSWSLSTSRNGFSLQNSAPYSGVHQAGASYFYRGKRIRIPSRKMIPTQQQGLGRWRSRLLKIARRTLSDMLRGR